MFNTEARTPSHQARLATTLAWVAGYTNIVGLVHCGVAVSHVSGTVSAAGRDLGEARWDLLALAAWLIGWFLAGAALSGGAIELAKSAGRRSVYVLPMTLEAISLCGFSAIVAWVDPSGTVGSTADWWAIGLACLAMGLQNATITSISGGVVRTTHVTGVVTDLGIELARVATRPMRTSAVGDELVPATGRIRLLAAILGSFLFGAVIATLLLPLAGDAVMAPPILFLLFILQRDVRNPIDGTADLGAAGRAS